MYKCTVQAKAFWRDSPCKGLGMLGKAHPQPSLVTAYALNKGTGGAEGYMEFQDIIWRNKLIYRTYWFEELGATTGPAA